ncbi:MAG: DUF167 domain-containing protein [Armatimonadota bacterium]|jgi:uncharacterized protein (TIGR00251 family)|nr:DUF167 domain-containing protein [Armatimonadota bacterium]
MQAATTLLRVRVQPRSSRNEVVAWRDGVLHVRVNAPPVEGAANRACAAVLAEALGVPKSAITLVSGERSREKTFRVVGITEGEAQQRLTP